MSLIMSRLDKFKKCDNCDQEIFGRSDKRFCGDQCRVSFNNLRNKLSARIIRKINKRLSHNYRILIELNPKGIAKKVKISTLNNAGFSFNYFTSIYITNESGNEYRYCYDHGYRILDDTWLLLVKNNMDS